MAKILGLDLGTNSIGWAVVDKTDKTINAGVTTFQRGVNLKKDGSNEEPLNVAKRKARQQRKQVFYKDYRLTKMTEVLSRFRMFPYLKNLDIKEEQEKIIAEIESTFNLTAQQVKNLKLNKYRDAYQLNARIAKFLLSKGIVELTPVKVDFSKSPETVDELIQHLVAFISIDPYEIRSRAISENITAIEFGRILYQIGKRRGFKSSRKVKNKDAEGDGKFQEKEIKKNNKKKDWKEELKKIQDKYPEQFEIIEESDEAIKIKIPKKLSEFYQGLDKTKEGIEKGNYITLGNYLFHKNSHEERIRKETRADRKLYVNEFNYLWNKHAETLGFNKLSGETRKRKKELVEISLREFLGDERKGILFYQRPLKSQKHLVAKCTYSNKNIRLEDNDSRIVLDKKNQKDKIKNTEDSRCQISHPLFERFRSLQQINNLKIERNDKLEILTGHEREILEDLFTTGCNETGKVSITKVIAALEIKKEQLKGAAESDVETWGEEDKKSKKKEGSFSGNYTSYKLSNLLGVNWTDFEELPKKTQERIENSCIRNIGGEAVKHDYSFKTEKKQDERREIVYATGLKLWGQLNNNERTKLCIERVHEEIWHCFSFYEDNDLLFDKLHRDFGLNESKKDDLRKINLKNGYGSFSLKTIKKILPFLEQGIKQTDSIFLANIDEVFGRNKWSKLSETEKQKIYKDVGDFIFEKQKEKKETELLNAALKSIKIEAEKSHEKNPALNEDLLKNTVREKVTGYLKYEQELDDKEREEKINYYFSILKPLTKTPIKPSFITTEPVEDLIKDYLKKKHSIDEIRLGKLWHPAKVEHLPPSFEELQEPKFQTLRNPIVKQALYSLRSVITEIEKKFGKPEKVRIELARELNDKNRRIAIRKWQKRKEKENEDASKELSKYKGLDPYDPENILKYKLWIELKEANGCHICPYTGKTICFTDLFEKNLFEVEHIIPRSRSWSDAEVNLTLCHIDFNSNIKRDYTPFEIKDITDFDFNKNWFPEERMNKKGKKVTYWHYRPLLAWRDRANNLSNEIEVLAEMIKTMNPSDARDLRVQEKYLKTYERNYYQSKYRRFQIENLSKDLNDDEEFVKSLITDTSYITKLAALYLKSYYGTDKVETVKGTSTSMLREEWNIGDKNRGNHYHHAEDATLIAFTDRAIYQELAQHRRKEKQNGKFNHPWGISEFKKKLVDAVMNIAVFDKQRNKKIIKYNKTIQIKGKKKVIEIESVRGAMHEANPYGKLKSGDRFSFRKAFIDLTEENRKNNLPEGLNWEPLDEKIEKKQLKSIKIEGIEKPVPLSKLQFSQLLKIEDDNIKELVEKRLTEKGIEFLHNDSIIPKEAFIEKLYYETAAKGKGEIKKCQILLEGEEEPINRKIVKGQKNILKIQEVPLITDDEIMNAIVKRLIEITEDNDKLREELGEELSAKFIDVIKNETFDLNIKLPDLFFEKKIRRGLRNFGIPLKRVTFIRQDNNEPRSRKKLEDKNLTYGDIPNLTEPARTIIKQRLKDIEVENGNDTDKLPDEFYEEKLYVPVKNVRTHYDIDLFPIREGNYFRFGNTEHAIIHQDKDTNKIYVEAVPFYFVINPNKYDEITRLKFFQGIGKKDADTFRLENLQQKIKLKNGDYFILGKKYDEVKKTIDEKKYFLLKESLYKVTMISATSFDIQFRKHYAAKSDVKDENKNMKGTDSWLEANPIKVEVSATGQIKLLQ